MGCDWGLVCGCGGCDCGGCEGGGCMVGGMDVYMDWNSVALAFSVNFFSWLICDESCTHTHTTGKHITKVQTPLHSRNKKQTCITQ
jgi:hypothetical protein